MVRKKPQLQDNCHRHKHHPSRESHRVKPGNNNAQPDKIIIAQEIHHYKICDCCNGLNLRFHLFYMDEAFSQKYLVISTLLESIIRHYSLNICTNI